MTVLAIMQGRLGPPSGGRIQSFPSGRWRDEFAGARSAGLAGIEWIYEADRPDANPLASEAGIREIQGVVRFTGARVVSVCADWFMTHPLITGGSGKLAWLVERAAQVGARHVVVPFVDGSALDEREIPRATSELLRARSTAERAGVEIHLETALPPDHVCALLARLPAPCFQVTYDIGNSAALGYDPVEELNAYGARVGSVHVKDRVRGGATVPLGEGAASISTVFRLLRGVRFDGTFVLQVARGADGHEIEWASGARELVERAWEDAR